MLSNEYGKKQEVGKFDYLFSLGRVMKPLKFCINLGYTIGLLIQKKTLTKYFRAASENVWIRVLVKSLVPSEGHSTTHQNLCKHKIEY